MIVFESCKWSNWFSYGSSNYIDFTKNKVTQLVGSVGAGKSSIPLIIQETCYGKNSKNIKKTNIRNRYVNDEVFSELKFNKDGDDYVIILTRKTNVKIRLIKNGNDISSHTAQNTVKQIEEIIGFPFILFSQLIYQSSNTSLEFLTSTDLNRKKFLISLFNLDKYVEIYEKYKLAIRATENDISFIDGNINNILKFIKENEDIELIEVELNDVPEYPKNLISRKEEIVKEIASSKATNNLILKNQEYKKLLESIDKSKLIPPDSDKIDTRSDTEKKNDLLADKRQLQKLINSFGTLRNVCPSCKQKIDNTDKLRLIEDYKSKISVLDEQLEDIDYLLAEARIVNDMWNQYTSATTEFEQLINYIDPNLPETLINKESLSLELAKLDKDILEITNTITLLTNKNRKIEANNSRVRVINEQLNKYKEDLEKYRQSVEKLRSFLSDLFILRDIFGTKGLVNYKIQYLVFDLQKEISKYLEQLSSGRFQLEFKLVSDKLNVVIYDGEYPIDIEALSSGELAKINIATLLAIRSIMSSISNTKINLLFLDESINVLDSESRESLIECLLEEENLNIFLMSHNYTHPLVPTIKVENVNGISSIEYVK